jgi:peptidyl-prolyl cis-trans isomerase SurA
MTSFFRPRFALLFACLLGVAALPLARAAEIGQQFARPPQGAQGEGPNAMSIAAVVNEDIITVYDVQARLGLFLATSGLDNTPEMQRRLIPQVVDALVEDHLKLQEAKRLKITTTDAEIRQSLDQIEQRNNMPAGAFRTMLAEKHVDPTSLYSQLEADLAWIKVVRQSLEREVSVQPQEVNAVLKRMKANQGKPEQLVAEIYLPVGSASPEPTARQLADRLVQQARGGTPFAALAQQFSQSPTAAVGGDLGWVVQGELEPELDTALARMEPKDISEPIRTASGYHILTLRERRASGAPDPKMAIVTLAQIYLPTEGGRALSPEKLAQASDGIRTQVKNCDEMNKWAADVGGPGSGPIPLMFIGTLPDNVRDVVTDLKPERVSPPIQVGGATLFVMVCTRQDDSGLPNEMQIKSNLENDKLTNAARQRLRDLRRQALIDRRY